jgi:hypothetical protein
MAAAAISRSRNNIYRVPSSYTTNFILLAFTVFNINQLKCGRFERDALYLYSDNVSKHQLHYIMVEVEENATLV